MANKEVDLGNYTDFDLYVAFLPFLKKYLRTKGKTFPKNMPVSHMVDLIRDEINSDYNLGKSGWGSEQQTKTMIRELAKKGLLRLPSQRPKVKFTKKYKKLLDKLFFSKINLPKHAKVLMKEDEPYNVEILTIVDWASAIKDPRFDMDDYKIVSKNLPKFLKRVLNIENLNGNPIKGQPNIGFDVVIENQNLEEFIKETKLIIRKSYKSDKIRSLRFKKLREGRINLQIVFPYYVHSNEKYDIKRGITEKLEQNGFNLSFINFDY